MKKIGQYLFLKELGAGGMARVSLCTAADGRLVVVKQPLVNDASVHAQLRDEARAGQRIQHPNVVETLDFFEHQNRPCLALAYVPGATLYQLRKKGGRLPQAVVARIGRQVADALHAIHTATGTMGQPLQMLHRDISPSNIILGHDGNARLIDLGIARSAESTAPKTRTGLLRGKIAFFAPELFDDGKYTVASDIWALGVVLLEAALGRAALEGSQPEIMGQICAGRVLRLREGEELDPSFFAALSRMLERNPKRRVKSAAEVAAMFAELEDEFGASQGMAARICQARVDAELPIVPETPAEELAAAFAEAEAEASADCLETQIGVIDGQLITGLFDDGDPSTDDQSATVDLQTDEAIAALAQAALADADIFDLLEADVAAANAAGPTAPTAIATRPHLDALPTAESQRAAVTSFDSVFRAPDVPPSSDVGRLISSYVQGLNALSSTG